MNKDIVKFKTLNGHLNRAGHASLTQPEMDAVLVLRGVIASYKENEAPSEDDKIEYLSALDEADSVIQQWRVRVHWYGINKKQKAVVDILNQFELGTEFTDGLVSNLDENHEDIKTAVANTNKFKKVTACKDIAR
jgi:hypothetical protein